MFIVTQKTVTIDGQVLPKGTTLAELNVTEGLPVKRVLASLSNGCAQLQDGPGEPEPQPADKPDGANAQPSADPRTRDRDPKKA